MPLPPFPLPPTRPLGSTRRQAASSPVLSDEEREWLLRRCDDIMAAYRSLPWVLRPGIVHGDAHTNNLLQRPSHRWVLIDWDSVSLGPPEYEFMPVYIRLRRFGYPQQAWRDFVAPYRTDLSDWPACRPSPRYPTSAPSPPSSATPLPAARPGANSPTASPPL